MTCVNSSHYCLFFHWFSCLARNRVHGHLTYMVFHYNKACLLAIDCSGSNCFLNRVQPLESMLSFNCSANRFQFCGCHYCKDIESLHFRPKVNCQHDVSEIAQITVPRLMTDM